MGVTNLANEAGAQRTMRKSRSNDSNPDTVRLLDNQSPLEQDDKRKQTSSFSFEWMVVAQATAMRIEVLWCAK